MHRSTFRYKAKETDAWQKHLRVAVKRYSLKHRRWGYPKITRLLQDDGWKVGKRMVQPIRRELGLRVPKHKPRRCRQGHTTGLPTKAEHRGHVWTWDFIHDRTVRGGRLREECLEREQLWTLSEARVVIEDWRREYNHVRPQRSLELETPKGFAALTQGGFCGRPPASLRTHLDSTTTLDRYLTYSLAPG